MVSIKMQNIKPNTQSLTEIVKIPRAEIWETKVDAAPEKQHSMLQGFCQVTNYNLWTNIGALTATGRR